MTRTYYAALGALALSILMSADAQAATATATAVARDTLVAGTTCNVFDTDTQPAGTPAGVGASCTGQDGTANASAQAGRLSVSASASGTGRGYALATYSDVLSFSGLMTGTYTVGFDFLGSLGGDAINTVGPGGTNSPSTASFSAGLNGVGYSKSITFLSTPRVDTSGSDLMGVELDFSNGFLSLS